MLAATRALAEPTRDEVPESVVKAYGDDGFEFGPEYLIPKPFDPRVLLHVSPAVAKAAMEPGMARITVDALRLRRCLRHPEATKVREAVDWIKRLAPELLVDGEMQADVAVDPHIIATKYPFSDLTGPANVLVFPTLSASNASYQLLAQLGNAEVVGPILLGMKKPVHILQRGCSVLDVVHLVGIASVDART